MGKNKQRWLDRNSTWIYILLSVVMVAVMLITVVNPLGLFTSHDAPFQILAACLGAIVTVIITAMLLNAQTKQQLQLQERQNEAQKELQDRTKGMELKQILKTKQYEEKLRIYQNYLLALSKAIEDRELSENEKITMQFRTAILSMHTNPSHVAEISRCFSGIFNCLCEESKGRKNEYDSKELQKQLFGIVRAFREELYSEEEQSAGSDNFDEACRIFGETFDKIDGGNGTATQIVEKKANTNWQVASEKWINDNWNIEEKNDWIRLFRKDSNGNAKPGEIRFGLYEGHYYIEATYAGNSDFAKALKWENGGRRQYGTWWTYIDDEVIHNLKEGEFGRVSEQSDAVQKILVGWVDYLIDIIARQDRSNGWREALKQKGASKLVGAKWSFFFWWWDTLACEYNNPELGTPYIDTKFVDNKIKVFLGVRNKELGLQSVLTRVGQTDVLMENECAVMKTFEAGTLDAEIADYLIDMMLKITK